MSQHHQRIRNDPRWKAARLACLERDGHACLDCGVTAEELEEAGAPLEDRLQVDHLEELAAIIDTAPELVYELTNLATRCGPCNRRRHLEGASTALVRRPWLAAKYRPALEPAGLAFGS